MKRYPVSLVAESKRRCGTLCGGHQNNGLHDDQLVKRVPTRYLTSGSQHTLPARCSHTNGRRVGSTASGSFDGRRAAGAEDDEQSP